MKIKSGGGYDSRQVKHSTNYKSEPVPHKASPAGGAPDPPSTAPGRDILSDYGPEKRRG